MCWCPTMSTQSCKFKIKSKKSLYLPYKNVTRPSIPSLLPNCLTRALTTKSSVHSLETGLKTQSLSLWITVTRRTNNNKNNNLNNKASLWKAELYCPTWFIKTKSFSQTRKTPISPSAITSSSTQSEIPSHISTYFNFYKKIKYFLSELLSL